MKFEEIRNQGWVLKCPLCDFDHNHLTSVKEHEQEGKKAVILEFDCENGHTYEVNLYNHKGYTISEIDVKD